MYIIRKLYFGSLALALHCYCGDSDFIQNTDFFQKTCLKEQQYGGSKNLNVTTNFHNNYVFQLSHGIKYIHRSNLHPQHTHWRKYFVQLILLKVCESCRFEQSKKTWSVLYSVWVFFAFIEKNLPNKYCLWEVVRFPTCWYLVSCAKV